MWVKSSITVETLHNVANPPLPQFWGKANRAHILRIGLCFFIRISLEENSVRLVGFYIVERLHKTRMFLRLRRTEGGGR